MTEAAIKMNTQSGLELEDVDAHAGPLTKSVLDLIGQLAAAERDVDGYQRAVADAFVRESTHEELAPWVEQALAERRDQVLYRRTTPDHRIAFQLLYLDPREVHPPHGHHNLISTQMILRGRVHAREYDRVARLDEGTVLLRLLSDGWMERGALLQATEVARNVHWFAADENPCVMLNFYVLGYQDWTFDPPDGRPHGRRLFDPTLRAQRDGLIVAPELPLAEGYQKFGNRPLAAFPVPRFVG
jgi:hypothetical protein